MSERDTDRLELILELIDHIERRTDGLPRALGQNPQSTRRILRATNQILTYQKVTGRKGRDRLQAS